MCIYICTYVTFIYTYTVYALVQVSACSHHLSFSATLPLLWVPESIEALNHFRISEAARSKARRFGFQLYLATCPIPPPLSQAIFLSQIYLATTPRHTPWPFGENMLFVWHALCDLVSVAGFTLTCKWLPWIHSLSSNLLKKAPFQTPDRF